MKDPQIYESPLWKVIPEKFARPLFFLYFTSGVNRAMGMGQYFSANGIQTAAKRSWFNAEQSEGIEKTVCNLGVLTLDPLRLLAFIGHTPRYNCRV